MSVCIVEPAFIEKQVCQVAMSPKQLIVPVERRCNPESHFEMVNGFLDLTLGLIYIAEKMMRFADLMLLAFLLVTSLMNSRKPLTKPMRVQVFLTLQKKLATPW